MKLENKDIIKKFENEIEKFKNLSKPMGGNLQELAEKVKRNINKFKEEKRICLL